MPQAEADLAHLLLYQPAACMFNKPEREIHKIISVITGLILYAATLLISSDVLNDILVLIYF